MGRSVKRGGGRASHILLSFTAVVSKPLYRSCSLEAVLLGCSLGVVLLGLIYWGCSLDVVLMKLFS